MGAQRRGPQPRLNDTCVHIRRRSRHQGVTVQDVEHNWCRALGSQLGSPTQIQGIRSSIARVTIGRVTMRRLRRGWIDAMRSRPNLSSVRSIEAQLLHEHKGASSDCFCFSLVPMGILRRSGLLQQVTCHI